MSRRASSLQDELLPSRRGSRTSGRPPAVLLGGGVIAASVARSLGRAGVEIHALGDADDPVRHSRYCTSFHHLGSDDRLGERWLAWLSTEGPQGAVVLPCNDDGLELVARNRTALLDLGYVVDETDDDVVLAMLDKEQTYDLARSAGIAAPHTVRLRDHAELELAATQIGLPCALKPLHSHRFARHFGVRVKVLVAHDLPELERAFRLLTSLDIEALLTEIIPGRDDRLASYYSYIDEDGEPLLHFTKRKLRQYPPQFGLGCYHVTQWLPEVADLGLRFFRAIDLRGLACVEFKRDARDGELKLIECNHRFTCSNELIRAAGLDLALFVYNRLVGLRTPAVNEFRQGLYEWDLTEDVRSFLLSRRQGELSFVRWARSLLHPQHFQLFHLDDPKPAIANDLRLLRKLASKDRRDTGSTDLVRSGSRR